MIPIKIKTSGSIELTNELRSYAEEKLAKFRKFIDPAETTALLEVELQAFQKGAKHFRAEVNFSSNGKVMRMESGGETLHAAIDAVVEEGMRRLRHHKGKNEDLLRRSAAKVKDFFRRFGS